MAIDDRATNIAKHLHFTRNLASPICHDLCAEDANLV